MFPEEELNLYSHSQCGQDVSHIETAVSQKQNYYISLVN